MTNTDARIFCLTDNTVVHILHPTDGGGGRVGDMTMVNAMTAAFGRSAAWLVSAAVGLLIAEVYYVQPELASIVPTLRLSDMAVGLMSAMAQQNAAADDLPLRCKARLALGYLTGLVAQARRARSAPAAARGGLRPARRGAGLSTARCEARRRPACGSCRARLSPTVLAADAVWRARA
jgi:hypothetical protein